MKPDSKSGAAVKTKAAAVTPPLSLNNGISSNTATPALRPAKIGITAPAQTNCAGIGSNVDTPRPSAKAAFAVVGPKLSLCSQIKSGNQLQSTLWKGPGNKMQMAAAAAVAADAIYLNWVNCSNQ